MEEAPKYTAEECVMIGVSGEAAVLVYYDYLQGGFIEDSSILLEKWRYGMDVRALTYCEDEVTQRYRSM